MLLEIRLPQMTKLRLRKIIAQPRYIFSIFVLLALIASARLLVGSALSDSPNRVERTNFYNNYVIFQQSFFHLIDGKDLYVSFPNEHYDLFKYTPTFAAVFGLFAVAPDWLGFTWWTLLNALILLAAIYYLPNPRDQLLPPPPPKTINLGNYAKGFIAICCLFDLDTTLLGVQSNGLMAGLIILSVGLLERNKYLWAAFCLVASIYIKLFGAVGLALFLLYPRQGKLALYTLFWAAVLGAAPLIFVSPAQYGDLLVSYWNLLAQDHAASAGISLIGLLNATLALPVNKSAAVLIGAVIFMLPFCRIKNYTDVKFRLLMLCAVLIWVIIFNHRTESATLIIATVGMALWFVVGEKNAMNLALFIAALSLTSLALTGVAAWFLWQWLGDRWKIYPAVAVGAAVLLALVASDIYFGFPLKMIYRAYIEPYSLRIAPCILIWLKLTCDLLAGKFSVAGEIEEPLKIKN